MYLQLMALSPAEVAAMCLPTALFSLSHFLKEEGKI